MKRARFGPVLLASVVAATLVAAAAPAGADNTLPGAFTAPQAAAPLGDAALRNLRGRYAPPQSATAMVPAAANLATLHRTASANAGGAAATSGGASLAGGPISGRVVYFGFDLSSAWTTHGPAGATTYRATEAVGVDLSGAQPSLTLQSSTARSGSAGPGAPSSQSNTVGAIGNGSINGVAQTIQIAGNDNTVANSTAIDVSAVRPTLVVGSLPGTACGSPCNVNVAAGALGVAIDLPGGKVSQGVAGGSLFQAVQLTTDNNTVANQLKLSLQVAPASTQAVTAPLNLIPPTLQLVH